MEPAWSWGVLWRGASPASVAGTYLALAVASEVAAALFVGIVRFQTYAFAIVGCLIVLSIWPVALYQILDTALGIALGLMAARLRADGISCRDRQTPAPCRSCGRPGREARRLTLV